MYKSHLSKEQEAKLKNRETVEQFLARGGQIEKVEEGVSGKRRRANKKNKIDAQALLDKAIGTPQEKEVIAFLKSQGIEVE
jgi:hypothetical protein